MRAASVRIAVAVDAMTATIREILRAGTNVAAHFALVAGGARAAASFLPFATALSHEAASFPCRDLVHNGGETAAEHCPERSAKNAATRS